MHKQLSKNYYSTCKKIFCSVFKERAFFVRTPHLSKNIGEVVKVLDKHTLHKVWVDGDEAGDNSIVAAKCLGAKLSKLIQEHLYPKGEKN